MTNVYASPNYVTDSLNGEYSITSLTKNYQMITFGMHDSMSGINKGDLYNFSYIEGPIIVNGNVYSENSLEFSTYSSDSTSYIAGDMGNNVYTDSMIATNDNFVDFEEMYVRVVNEQKALLDKATDLIADDIVITSPGSYTIHNTSRTVDLLGTNAYDATTVNHSRNVYLKKIYIDNYNSNDYYVFNLLNEFVLNSFEVYLRQAGEATYHSLWDHSYYDDYSGNIIFSYPNARYMDLISVPGTIIAPKADVTVHGIYLNYDELAPRYVGFFGNIYANSIQSAEDFKHNNDYDSDGVFHFIPNSVSKKLLNESVKGYVVEYKDFLDDLYSGNYSIADLLENYSIVSLGQKNYESNSKFLNLNNYKNGSAILFHIAGQFLINGDLGVYPNNYPNTTGWGLFTENAMRLDLESNKVSESNVAGSIRSPYIIKFWQLHGDKVAFGSTNLLFTTPYQEALPGLSNWINSSMPATANSLLMEVYKTFGPYNSDRMPQYVETESDFINYERLYENIVAQQANIKKGQSASPSDGVVHISVGSNYVIDNISDVNEIIFDNFEDNKDQITIVTINNSGSIHFPKVSKNSDGYRGVITNDYYGKEEATYSYEYSNFVTDSYHGNIIWNVPNATFIELAEGAPFIGHLIAPNADVETPELHFAGCFIVNSLYCEGNTEAHFYPLTASKANIIYTDSDGIQKQISMRIGRALGDEYINVDTIILGDCDEYLEDLKREESEGIPLINPFTFKSFGNLMIVLVIISVTVIFIKSKKKKLES